MNTLSQSMKKSPAGWIPREWDVPKLGDATKCYSGGTPSRTKPEYYNGKIPWIKSGELNQVHVHQTEEKISSLALENSSAKIVPPNTVLLALYGATAGVIGVTKIETAINQAILAIIPSTRLTNEFLFYVLHRTVQTELSKVLQGGQPNLSAEIVKSFFIPLPPLPEQRKIAAIFSTWDRALEKMEALIVAKRRLKRGLMQILMTGGKSFLSIRRSEWSMLSFSIWQRVEAASKH